MTPTAGNVQGDLFVKKTSRRPRRVAPKGPWMSVLARLAAESRADGGEGLHELLYRARFYERPHLSLTKRAA